jgi:hypothetical protein
MGTSAAFAVERVERVTEHEHRLAHMGRTVVKWLTMHSPQELSEAERSVWFEWLGEMERTDPERDPVTAHQLIRRGYRMVLFSENPHNASVRADDVDFDELPDALDELSRRRRAV